jgi:hypothetical protein
VTDGGEPERRPAPADAPGPGEQFLPVGGPGGPTEPAPQAPVDARPDEPGPGDEETGAEPARRPDRDEAADDPADP